LTAPLLLLGVRRSGTTLLRVILDRSSAIAIPDESYFVPQLAHRHPDPVDPDRFLDDLRRLPTLAEWGLSAQDVATLLRPGMATGEAIAAVFRAYAATRGRPRWGDKTPMYMQHVSLLERLFPDALFVHLIRDGRDAALSFLQMPEGIVTRTWAHPRSAAGFACQWRTELRAARSLGQRLGASRYLEVRYEDLVGDPPAVVRSICEFAGLSFDPGMLDYAGTVDVSAKPHLGRLRQPPTKGVRDWHVEMKAEDARAFEVIAGDLLAELGYELREPGSAGAGVRGRLSLGWYRARLEAWHAAGYAFQRSPLWARRHPARG
jgi:LPS sulfotransferase NodH